MSVQRNPGEGDGAASERRVFFHQGCPVCGRRLEIDVSLLGRRVYCQHCGGGFRAMDPELEAPAGGSAPRPDRVELLLARPGRTHRDDAG